MKNIRLSCSAHSFEHSLQISSAWANELPSYYFVVFYIFTTKNHFHSSKLVHDRISKIRNLLPNVPNLIKCGGIAHHNQQHERLNYFLSETIPFNYNFLDFLIFLTLFTRYHFIQRLILRILIFFCMLLDAALTGWFKHWWTLVSICFTSSSCSVSSITRHT